MAGRYGAGVGDVDAAAGAGAVGAGVAGAGVAGAGVAGAGVAGGRAGDRPVRSRLTHLPSGLKASAVLFVLTVAGAAGFAGFAGAAGAAAGVALVVGSFTVSSLAIAWADSVAPSLVLPVGMLAYVVKFTAIGFVMAAVAATGWAGLPALGVGVIVATVGWATAQAWWTWHAKIPYVDV
jgi:hypothetical protein